MTQTAVIVTVIVTTPLWFFQISVIIFLMYHRYRKHESYCTSFYLLFTMLCILDSFSEFMCFVCQRMIAFPSVHEYYLNSPIISSILYLYSAFSLYVQCLLHLFIAVNRIWTVFKIVRHLPSKLGRLGTFAIAVLPFLPIPLLIPRFFHSAEFYVNVDGSLSLRYRNPGIQQYQSTTSTCVIFFTAIPTFILEIFTICKYRQLLARIRLKSQIVTKKFYHDYRLLCQAVVVLVMKVIVCGCQALALIATLCGNTALFEKAITIYSYSCNVLDLIGPVALVIVSRQVRSDYVAFWRSVYYVKRTLATVAYVSESNGRSKRSLVKI
uniref:G_PROTEIN_RECEP_F1_2 domain-containing protein n=1 Tax=Panagrellus redivivus TaxID=6233 RepID=A0A7E4VDX1_PANRE